MFIIPLECIRIWELCWKKKGGGETNMKACTAESWILAEHMLSLYFTQEINRK